MKKFLLQLFREANSGNYAWKKAWFYPFKGRLLKRFGKPDGYDEQRFPGKICFRCDGVGREPWEYSECDEPCQRCGGSGWWMSPKTVYLHRFMIWGGLFHTPKNYPPGDGPLYHEPVERFEGLLPRRDVDYKTAVRSALVLMAVFEPWTFLIMRWQSFKARMKYRWRFSKVRNYFANIRQKDLDIPF